MCLCSDEEKSIFLGLFLHLFHDWLDDLLEFFFRGWESEGEGLEEVGKSVTGGDKTLLGVDDTLINVIFWKGFSFLDALVDEVTSDLERFGLPGFWSQIGDVVEFVYWPFGHQGSNASLESSETCSIEW